MPTEATGPAYGLERLVGLLLDVIDGDGGRPMAAYLDCHCCRTPLVLSIDERNRQLHAWCPRNQDHLVWLGGYLRLPAWMGEYERLNRS